MFNAYIETVTPYFDGIEDASVYNEVLGYYFELAELCGERLNDFIVNVAMHFERWGETGRQARLNVLRHYRQVRR